MCKLYIIYCACVVTTYSVANVPRQIIFSYIYINHYNNKPNFECVIYTKTIIIHLTQQHKNTFNKIFKKKT